MINSSAYVRLQRQSAAITKCDFDIATGRQTRKVQ